MFGFSFFRLLSNTCHARAFTTQTVLPVSSEAALKGLPGHLRRRLLFGSSYETWIWFQMS